MVVMGPGPLSREDCPQTWRGNLRRLWGWNVEDHETKLLPGQVVRDILRIDELARRI